MITLWLLRHARSEANVSGVLAGQMAGVALDQLGHSQAEALGDRLAQVPFAAVGCSPMLRCQQTAEHVVQRNTAGDAVPVVDVPGVIECDYGQWSGRPLAELVKEPLWQQVAQRPSAVQFPDGESMVGMSHRAVTAVTEFVSKVVDGQSGSSPTGGASPGSAEQSSPDQSNHSQSSSGESAKTPDAPGCHVAIVSHGDVIKAIVAHALGLHLDLFQRLAINTASVSVLQGTPGAWAVVRYNDTAELPVAAPVSPSTNDGSAAASDAGGSAGGPVVGGSPT